MWQVWGGDCWIDYDSAFCHTLEQAAQEQKKDFDAAPKRNVMFRYNLMGMWQESLVTHTHRSIRRMLWWEQDVDKFTMRMAAVDQHNKDHSNPRAGRQPSASPTRSRSKGASRGERGW